MGARNCNACHVNCGRELECNDIVCLALHCKHAESGQRLRKVRASVQHAFCRAVQSLCRTALGLQTYILLIVPRQVPVTFMYGDHDWMDPAGAHRAAAGMAERRAAAGPGDQQVITVKVG